jgi:competence protein ComEC
LIDTGPRDAKYDAGKMRVLPYLLRHGAQRVDFMVLTHPHADHIGGAASLISLLKPVVVIDPSIAVGESQYIQTMRIAEHRHVRWLKSRDGRRLDLDGVHFQFLYPASDSLDGSGDANDLSVALRVEYGRFSAMFMGDAPTATEDMIVAQYGPRIASQVLKVGHHGSRTATGETFTEMVHPSLALVSVGRDNKYGLPDEDVLARLLRHGVRVLRTDEHGAIVVRGDATGRYTVATQR